MLYIIHTDDVQYIHNNNLYHTYYKSQHIYHTSCT